MSHTRVFQHVDTSVAGVWTDNALINESSPSQPAAQAALDVRSQRNLPAVYFGGVAFKYQRAVRGYAQAASRASPFMDVVTTSGARTGRAAPLQKIKSMKSALGSQPLAIASGITPENVGFLVATGISSSFTELDAERVRALVTRVRESG